MDRTCTYVCEAVQILSTDKCPCLGINMSEIPHYHFFYKPEELQKNDGHSMLDNDFVYNNQLPTPQSKVENVPL